MAEISDLIARPPLINFSQLADPFKGYQEGRDMRSQMDIQNALKQGVPKNPNGTLNFGAMIDQVARSGNLGAVKTIADLMSSDFDRQVKMRGLDIQQKAAEKDQPQITYIGTPDGRKQQAIVNPSKGTVQPIGAPVGDDNKLTATDRRAIFESEDANAGLESTIATLNTAKGLVPNAFTGYTAGLRGEAITKAPSFVQGLLSPENRQSAEATAELNRIMSLESIKSMSATLKGATTDRELFKFESILADPSTPPQIRGRIIDRMLQLAERQKQINIDRTNQLRGGSYYKPGGGVQPAVASAPATAAPPSPTAARPQVAPQEAITQARAAIAAGAPREAVIQRLKELGLNVSGI